MANENEDVLSANDGAPAADIPNLKKKEKERKKAGAAWSGARGAASEFSGATGGNVARAAASAASAAGAEGAGALAAEAVEGAGFFSRFLATMMSTALGKAALAAAAFLMIAAAGLAAYALLKGGGAQLGAPNLGAISDSMRVRAGGGDRMSVASNGEIRFDPANPNANKPAPTEEKKVEEKPAPDAKPVPDADQAANAARDQLAHNLSGAKLSSSLGGDFGNKNIFAGGNGGAGKFDTGKVALPKFAAQKGKLTAMSKNGARGSTSAEHISHGHSKNAIAQLKLAKGMSLLGAASNTNEQAATAAQGAFDQSATDGGNLSTTGGYGPHDTAPAQGGGAPDTSMPTAPATPTGTSYDPNLQNALGQIGQMADMASMMMMIGIILGVIGAALMLIGYNMLPWPWAWAIIAAGAAVLIAGIMMVAQANSMKDQAKQMGQNLASSIGNKQQGDAINYCTDQAVSNQTQVENCQPPESITQSNEQNAQDQKDIQRVKDYGATKPTISQ